MVRSRLARFSRLTVPMMRSLAGACSVSFILNLTS